MKATTFLSPEDRARVESAIADAEKRTAAEIVCAVATESGRYDRAESLVGLAGSLAGLSVAHLAASGQAQWGSTSPGIGWQALAVALGFVAGSVVASRFHPLRALLVPRGEMAEETVRAAASVFSQRRLASTRKRAGVLLYVSLFERRAVVLADEAAMAALGQKGLDGLRDVAVAWLRQGKRAETFTAALTAAADRLSRSLPPEPRNPNELPNRVLIFHPRP